MSSNVERAIERMYREIMNDKKITDGVYDTTLKSVIGKIGHLK